jgi:glyoxylate carboligase
MDWNVVIVHAEGEEYYAEKLAAPMRKAGYTVHHGGLVPRVVQNAGYNLFSFTRASPVVNCQSALV